MEKQHTTKAFVKAWLKKQQLGSSNSYPLLFKPTLGY